MGILTVLKRKYIAYKFSSGKLNIIQYIESGQLSEIMSSHVEEGWELSSDYRMFDESFKTWSGKLRKGSISLEVSWEQGSLGEIVGPERVIQPMARKFKLVALKHPRWDA
ncbi:hypothetical protein [Agaribacter flavus]|uniref:DUF4177 domain-containing protein n=1 Tax=Agaribacter flavus TaxID=1902781 RepID=A0ABV7FSP9_9ALTE